MIDDPAIRRLLRRVVLSVTTDEELREDLIQEALIHLWQKELRQPGQTRCWYLQSCRFHLLDILNRGRSVDSYKRRFSRCPLKYPLGEDENPPDQERAEPVLSSISARDILSQLLAHCSLEDCTILAHLVDGFGVREIAAKLHCSHQAVSRHRRRIARIAAQLDIGPQSVVDQPRAASTAG